MAAENPIRLSLKADFRYFHEPLTDDFIVPWSVGRTGIVRELADRIMFSCGGAFLLSGMRGVGKTTFVRHAMHTIRSEHDRYAASIGPFELLDVWLNLARPIEPIQLLHLLIRHLYLRLKETGIVPRLNPELQKDLSTAFLRTSFEISSRSLSNEERGRGMEVGMGKAPWLGIEFLGKISSSYKHSHSDEEALKYLPYDETAAEFELLNFSRRLLTGINPPVSRWQRLTRWIRSPHPAAHTAVKVVFVLDELDKLESLAGSEKSSSPLTPILQSLKTALSASGMSFVFIGGKEAEEKMLEDVSHGDSIYESIFSYNLYLPCLWADQDELMGRSLALKKGEDPQGNAKTVGLYLRYKGRGIPRRTWRELNKYVNWLPGFPAITLELAHVRYMKVFAKLETSLQEDELFAAGGAMKDEVRVDRKRLFFYYIADWILSRERETFSQNEVTDIVNVLNLGGSLKPVDAERIARSTIRLLQSRAFIERADQSAVRLSTLVDHELYRVCPWVLRALEGLPERQPTLSGPDEIPRSSPSARLAQIGQYIVIEEIGSGGTSNVYKVRHPSSEKYFAAKILRPEMNSSQTVRAFFQREIDSTRILKHPGIISIYDSGQEDGRPYYIMDLLDGISLGSLLDSLKTLEIGLACRIARSVAKIAQEIHSKGFFRLDIKPNNIFLTRTGEVVLLDLGILMSANTASVELESDNRPIGTIGYMAPEQIVNPRSVDSRIDIYSVGMVLYECLVGELPFPLEDPLRWAGLANEVPLLTARVPVPGDLALVVSRMVAREPNSRYPSMADVESNLRVFAGSNAEPMVRVIEACKSTRATSRQATEIPVSVSFDAPPAWVPPPVPTGSPALVESAPSPHAPPVDTLSAAPTPAAASAPSVPHPPEARPITRVPLQPRSSEEAESHDLFEIRSADRLRQEAALNRLSSLTGTPQLLFDFLANICIWCGPGAVARSISMDRPNLILGRNASQVDFPLTDPSISRQHAVFHVKATADGRKLIYVEDLSSKSGTTINHVSLDYDSLGMKKLFDGDLLRVGACDIRIHVLPMDRTIISEREFKGEATATQFS